MAELSAETEAIIDRLKREGELLRNSGSNSIRSVKVELSKFEGIFNTISNNITSQTDTMRASMSAQADIAERQAEQAARDRAFADLEANQESAELKALREKVETEKLKNELASEKDKAKGPGLFEKLQKFGALKTLIGGTIGIAGLAVGYGYLNARTDGGLDRMVNAVATTAWSKISTSFNMLADKMPGILTNLETITDPKYVEAIAVSAASAYAGLKVGQAIIEGAADALLTSAIIDAIRGRRGGRVDPTVPPPAGERRGGADADRRNGRFTRPTIRGVGIAGVAATALSVIMPNLSDYVRTEFMGMTKDELANRKYDFIDATGAMVTGASLGMMFGPYGALAGAVLGAAYAVGSKVVEYVKEEVMDEGPITQRLEDELEDIKKNKTDAEKKYNDIVEKRKSLAKSLTEAQLESMGLGLEAMEAAKATLDAEKAEASRKITRAAVQSAESIQAEIDDLASQKFREMTPMEKRQLKRIGRSAFYDQAKAKFEENRLAEIERLQQQQDQTIQTALSQGADATVIEQVLTRLENPYVVMTPEQQNQQTTDQLLRDLGIGTNLENIISTISENAGQPPVMILAPTNNVSPVVTNVNKQGDTAQTQIAVASGGGGSGGSGPNAGMGMAN